MARDGGPSAVGRPPYAAAAQQHGKELITRGLLAMEFGIADLKFMARVCWCPPFGSTEFCSCVCVCFVCVCVFFNLNCEGSCAPMRTATTTSNHPGIGGLSPAVLCSAGCIPAVGAAFYP